MPNACLYYSEYRSCFPLGKWNEHKDDLCVGYATMYDEFTVPMRQTRPTRLSCMSLRKLLHQNQSITQTHPRCITYTILGNKSLYSGELCKAMRNSYSYNTKASCLVWSLTEQNCLCLQIQNHPEIFKGKPSCWLNINVVIALFTQQLLYVFNAFIWLHGAFHEMTA